MHKGFILFLTAISVILSGVAVQAAAPYYVESGGVVSMEAENFSSNNGYVFSSASTVTSPDHGVMDASNFTGTGYMSTNRTGVQMDYVIQFTTTGTYWINLRSLAGGHYENGFCAKFDGSWVVGPCSTRGGHGINTAKWARWAWVSKAQYPDEPLLRSCVSVNVTTPGKHTFSILQRESLAWLDKIVFQRTSLCGQTLAGHCQGCMAGTAGPPESQRITGSGSAPTATTGAATLVTSDGATLNGTVNPNSLSTTAVFDYGETTSYGSTVTAAQSPLSGSIAQAVSAQISGLTQGGTYHFRARASSSGGIGTGDDQTFVTGQTVTAPTATTGAASSVSSNSATLNGSVNPNDASTTVMFEYGETSSYGSTTTATQSPIAGSDIQTVSAPNITGLTQGSTYHFRVSATNAGGTGNGDDHTFVTNYDTVVIQNQIFTAGTVTRYVATISIRFGPNVRIKKGATVELTAPLVTGVSDVTVEEDANLTITTP